MEVWQIVIQLVLLPTSIVAVLAFVIREVFKSYLSMDVERYKTTLQTDLESHKAKLKAEYDLRHFEFQTRFSLLHQKRADAIEKLFALLAKIQNDLRILANWENATQIETKEEFYAKTVKDLNGLCEYFDEKRIYFDDEVKTGTITIVTVTSFLKSGLEPSSSSNPEIMTSLQRQARNIIDQHIDPVMNKLEEKFKVLLSAESPNYLPGKSNDR